jgi:hypothetical protein
MTALVKAKMSFFFRQFREVASHLARELYG